MKPGSPSAATVALASLAALVAGLAAWGGYDALSKPAHFAARSAAVDAQLDRAARLNRGAHGGDGYPEHAVCGGLGDAELSGVTRAISGSATAAGVTLTDLVATPPAKGRESSAIAPVALRVQGVGPYEAVSGWIDRLAHGEPEIFVESLDLVSRAPNVSLKLTGKVFCWTSSGQS